MYQPSARNALCSYPISGSWSEAPAARVVLRSVSTRALEAPLAATVEPVQRRKSMSSEDFAHSAVADAESEVGVAVSERDAADRFAQMAQRLMKDPERKRPAGMPERRKRTL